jgi:hypothetical protein
VIHPEITSDSFARLIKHPGSYADWTCQLRTKKAETMPLNSKAIFPASDPEFISFPSRRSVVHSSNGIVSCTQPLASEAGLKILRRGGNAAVSRVYPFSNHSITIYRTLP